MLAAPERLSPASRKLVASGKNELLLSAASAWEIAIKHGLKKIALPAPPAEVVPAWMETTAVTPLPVLHRHALHVASLPRHHRDLFDRLLIAQAIIEDLPLLTADRAFARYEVELLRA